MLNSQKSSPDCGALSRAGDCCRFHQIPRLQRARALHRSVQLMISARHFAALGIVLDHDASLANIGTALGTAGLDR